MRPDGRAPPLASDPAYVKGLVEVQDEGSQLAALLAEAKAGMQVLDLCAGAGGKTLALAAAMENQGQIYAADPDAHRLAPIFARLARSGARNVQVRAPRGREDVLADLEGRCDLVLIDAPCTGSGAWRRNPDAKWRIRPGALEQRIKDQDETLENALRFVKRGGRIVYITCSVLKAENEDRIAEFMARHDDFLPVDAGAEARSAGLPALAEHRSSFGPGFRLSPRATGTDGFYVATLAGCESELGFISGCSLFGRSQGRAVLTTRGMATCGGGARWRRQPAAAPGDLSQSTRSDRTRRRNGGRKLVTAEMGNAWVNSSSPTYFRVYNVRWISRIGFLTYCAAISGEEEK